MTPDNNGLLVADKPVGPSSFAVIARVRKLYHERQVGHAGTLDPLASGVLPVLVGEATKLAPYLMDLEKVYRATARLGATTDTYDAEGRVTSTSAPETLAAVDEGRVREALSRFVGRIAQRPPAYSAIKKDGVPLYRLARADVAVQVETREVVIHAIDVERWEPPDVSFTVRCGKGTYIRSLAHDLGAELGVGAHLVALRRTRVGPFTAEEARDPFQLEVAAPLLPPARVLAHLPAFTLSPLDVERLRMGQQAPLATLPPPEEGRAARLLDEAGELVAIAECVASQLRLARVFHPPRK